MAFTVTMAQTPDESTITLVGELDAAAAPQFMAAINQASVPKPKHLVLMVSDLEFMASAGLRVLIFARQKMGPGVSIHVVGVRGAVLNTIKMSGFHHSVFIQDTYSPQ